MAEVKKSSLTAKETDPKTVKTAPTADATAKQTKVAAAAQNTPEKDSARKVAGKDESEKKATAKKPGRKPGRKPAAKKEEKTAKRAARKPASAVRENEIYVEYAEKTVVSSEIIAKIEEAYKAEGHRVGAIKKMEVYVNIGEDKAYYVINGKAEGKFVEL